MPFDWKYMQMGVFDANIEQRVLDLALYTATFTFLHNEAQLQQFCEDSKLRRWKQTLYFDKT